MKNRQRVIVMTDISSLTPTVLEPDDGESMVRFLLYCNEWDVEGLIATAYRTSKGMLSLGTEYLHQLVDAYEKVYPNLILHEEGYPEAKNLRKVIKTGYIDCGVQEPGEGMDTEASEWIISVVDREDERPVWFLLWGGSTDLAQAIWRVDQQRSREEAVAWRKKLRIYSIQDQYGPTGPWIRAHFPDLFYMTSYLGHRGIYRMGDERLSGEEWVRKHILNGKGALGEAYPIYHGGDPWGKVHGLKEGDTPSFLYLIPNGLHDPLEPQQSNWGGIFRREADQYRSDVDEVGIEFSASRKFSKENLELQFTEAAQQRCEQAGVFRWRADFQADFAARLDWCVIDTYEKATHAPTVKVTVKKENNKLLFDASSSLSADGQGLEYRWILEKAVETEDSSAASRIIQAVEFDTQYPWLIQVDPNLLALETELILCVSGTKQPAMTRYKRFVFSSMQSL